MRVVAGTLRGRRLVTPSGEGVRPTSDRVREAMFNALGSLGALAGADVVDLFGGSGALGIEALSRGAASATFVERDRAALAALASNLTTLGLDDRAEIVRADALGFLDRADRVWDLALLDPPYAFDRWGDLLSRLPADLAVIESGAAVSLPGGWVVVREKAYGSTVVTIARRTGPDGASGPAKTT